MNINKINVGLPTNNENDKDKKVDQHHVNPHQRIKELNSLLRILNADEQIKQLGETEKLLKESIKEGWGDKDFEERKLKIIYKRAMDLGIEKHRLEEEKRMFLKILSMPPKPTLEYEE